MRTTTMTLVACCSIALAVTAEEPAKTEKDKIVREIVGQSDVLSRAEIAKQVDFSKEYLLYFHWSGVADDELKTTLKDGPIVVFNFTPGRAKNKEIHDRVYVLTNKASWQFVEKFKSTRTPRITKISTAEELAKTFPDPK